MNMNGTTNVSAVEANGVGVYSDNNCSKRVSSIDWGTLEPGLSKDITIHIRNEENEPLFLVLWTTNWNPSKSSKYMDLKWNYSARQIDPDEVLQITLTLSISRHIEGISNFSFDMVIRGSQNLLGDINGDGEVTLADVGKLNWIYSSFL